MTALEELTSRQVKVELEGWTKGRGDNACAIGVSLVLKVWPHVLITIVLKEWPHVLEIAIATTKWFMGHKSQRDNEVKP